jgi:RND family efflux transporter MFP subunit
MFADLLRRPFKALPFDRRPFRFGLAAGVLVLAAAITYVAFVARPVDPATTETDIQTSVVRQGDLILYASGSGTLIAGVSADLEFGTNGSIAQLNVQAGDEVEAGDILAEQGNREQLEAAVATDELALLGAQQALDELIATADLAAAEAQLALANAQATLEEAQSTWQSQQAGYRASSTTIRAAEAELALAKQAMEEAEGAAGNFSSDDPQYAQAYKNYAAAVQRYWSALANLNWYTGHPTATQQSKLDAELALAQAQLAAAERSFAELQDGPDPDELAMAELRVAKAEADLALSRQNLKAAVIVAPFSGTIMQVTASVGQSVSGPFITIANLNQPQLEIYLDETDAGQVAVGYEVEVVFDALPDEVFTGRVIQVDPMLNSEFGVSTVKATVQLEGGDYRDLLVGMNASVDVISGRAEGVALVPVEALRELEPGEYAVFVMENGEPRLRMVEVGLTDLTFAEIVSGVSVGEIVTTGIVETE